MKLEDHKEFIDWFKNQDFYANMMFVYGSNLFNHDDGVYRVLPVRIAHKAWVDHKSEIDRLQQLVGELHTDVKKWKQNSVSAMIHGNYSCGDPWQEMVSDKEGFNRLHCFACNNDRYESHEFFGN